MAIPGKFLSSLRGDRLQWGTVDGPFERLQGCANGNR